MTLFFLLAAAFALGWLVGPDRYWDGYERGYAQAEVDFTGLP